MLRTRLFLNLLPFVVILVAVGVYAMVLFSRLAHTLDTTIGQNYRALVAAQETRLALAGLEREVWISLGDRWVNEDAFNEQRQKFEENLTRLQKASPLPGEKDLNELLADRYAQFLRLATSFSNTTNSQSQRRLYESDLLPAVRSMNATLEKIRTLNHDAIAATSEQIQKITRDVTRLMLLGLVAALVLTAYAWYAVSRSILRPIQLLTKATTELGEGHWQKPVPVISRDELGELARSFNKMAAQLQEYRQSTAEHIVQLHRTMESTLASFPDPIFVLDHAGKISLQNPAASEFTTALHLAGALPDKLQAIARETLAANRDFLPHSFNEVLSFRLYGAEKFFLPRVVAMRDKQQSLVGVAVVLYDVTRFRLLDAAKTNLVATVSHELRTPLTSVRMALHLLLEKSLGQLSPQQEEMLQTARQDAERLLRILNDLLDLARLEEGAAELRKVAVHPAELLQAVATENADLITARQTKLTWHAQPHLPQVSIDQQRMRHVFGNLLTNAVKNSPAGGEIVMRAELTPEKEVRFAVTDQGPGIPEEYQTRIFDRFFRVPGTVKTGAGLGLSIAREITVAHGGRIGVKSQPGQGSTFYVILKAGPPGSSDA